MDLAKPPLPDLFLKTKKRREQSRLNMSPEEFLIPPRPLMSTMLGPWGCIKFRTAANNGGLAYITTQNIFLNDSRTLYAAGYDTYGNYLADQSIPWSTTGALTDLPNPEVGTATRIVGTKIGSGGTVHCSSCAGSPSLIINVSAGSGSTLTWTTASNDSESHQLIANNSTLASTFMSTPSGATWRTSTSGSWDDESASATRSSRSTFPTRVFLVASSAGLNIIDATSNDLFMKFNLGSGNALDSTYGSLVDVVGLGSKVFVAMTGGLTIIDFASDEVFQLNSTSNYKFSSNISGRNSGSGTWSSNATYPTLSHSSVNKLAAQTISSNEYIAIATNSGVDLLQLADKSIYSSTDTTSTVTAVALSTDSKLYYFERGAGLHRADLTLALSADFSDTYLYDTGKAIMADAIDIKLGEGESAHATGDHVVTLATEFGLSVIQEHSTDSSATFLNYSAEGVLGSSGRVTSSFGNAIAFDGNSGYLSIADGGSLTDTATIELLFQPSVNLEIGSGNMVLLQKGDDTTDNSFGFKFNSTTGKIDFFIRDDSLGTPVQLVSSTTVSWTAGTWYHLAAKINSANGIELWVNGAEHATNSVDLSSGTGSDFNINTSSLSIGGSGTGEYFKGAIDEVRIMNTASTYSGATISVPTSEHTDNAANVVHLFHFDEVSGVTSLNADNIANVDATLNGSTWFTHPKLAIDSPVINAITLVTGAGTVSGYAGADDGFIELQNLDTTSAITIVDTTTQGVKDVDVYHVDGVFNYDVLKGLSTGGLELVRE